MTKKNLQDNSATPHWVLDQFADEVLVKTMNARALGPSVLDPCSGDGRFRDHLRHHAGGATDAGIFLNNDIKGGGDPVLDYSLDFLGDEAIERWAGKFDTVIANPPFKLMTQFIKRSFLVARKRVIILGRLAILAGQARFRELHSNSPPASVWIMTRRPSFSGDGKTDVAQEYAWFVWENTSLGWRPEGYTTLHWLPPDKHRGIL